MSAGRDWSYAGPWRQAARPAYPNTMATVSWFASCYWPAGHIPRPSRALVNVSTVPAALTDKRDIQHTALRMRSRGNRNPLSGRETTRLG